MAYPVNNKVGKVMVKVKMLIVRAGPAVYYSIVAMVTCTDRAL